MRAVEDRPHRGLFWLFAVLAVAVLVVGVVIGLIGYARTSGPDGAVRGYFAALERGDASAALGYGDIPAGRNMLLSAKVLREQRRIASISEVRLTDTAQHGDLATVSVSYVLTFGGVRVAVHDAVALHKHGSWRVSAVAVPVQLNLQGAANRATVVGAPVPTDTVLAFPGAVPIAFDTPNLALDPGSSIIHLDGGGAITIGVTPTTAGRAAAQSAVAAAATACILGGSSTDPRCPLPPGRAVPGSLSGTPPANLVAALHVSVSTDPEGLFVVTGNVTVQGRYSNLNFDNVASTVRGTFLITFDALVYAKPPVAVMWQGTS